MLVPSCWRALCVLQCLYCDVAMLVVVLMIVVVLVVTVILVVVVAVLSSSSSSSSSSSRSSSSNSSSSSGSSSSRGTLRVFVALFVLQSCSEGLLQLNIFSLRRAQRLKSTRWTHFINCRPPTSRWSNTTGASTPHMSVGFVITNSKTSITVSPAADPGIWRV